MTVHFVDWFSGSFELLLIGIDGDPDSPYVLNNMLHTAVGLKDKQLEELRRNHRARLTPIPLSALTPGYNGVKDFILANKEKLNIKRVRGNILLWPLKVALRVCMYANNATAERFHDESIEVIIRHATEGRFLIEEYQKRFETIENRVKQLEEERAELARPLQQQASAAGQTLSLHRRTKDVRDLLN